MGVFLSYCRLSGSRWLHCIFIGLYVAIILAAKILFFNITLANAASVGACLALENVESWDFLYIRKKPDHRSEKVGAIAPNTSGPIFVTGKCTPNTKNLKDLWCPVEYFITSAESRRGYVKMFYTKPAECPPSV